MLKNCTLVLWLTIFSAAPWLVPQTWAGQECADLVMATCTKCHYQGRICEKLGKKSQRAWQVTIKRMLRYGLALNDSEQERMLKCLMSLEQNSGKLCQ